MISVFSGLMNVVVFFIFFKWKLGEIDVTLEFIHYRADVVSACKRYSVLSVADKLYGDGY